MQPSYSIWCGFVIAPTPIDLDKAFTDFARLGETGNYLVLTVVCSIFGVYLLLIIWARKANLQDQRKVCVMFTSLCSCFGIFSGFLLNDPKHVFVINYRQGLLLLCCCATVYKRYKVRVLKRNYAT